MSDTLIIDLSNYKERVGARVPAGSYTVQIEDVETTKSKAGNPMVNIWLRIVGGEHAGATIIDRLTLSDNAMFRVVNFMQALGLPTPKKRLQINVLKWVGQTLVIDVEDGEPFRGTVKSEVRGYSRAEKPQAADLEDSSDDELPEPETAAESADESSTIEVGEDAVDLDTIEL